MTGIRLYALESETAARYRAGAPDANGMVPERAISSGETTPCRHCLNHVPKGAGMLILAHRPFPEPQPYAELGPIFLCAEECVRYRGEGLPPFAATSPDFLVKGYNGDDRIIYGTGSVVPRAEVESYAEGLLARGDVAYVHVRSARNNCFLFRIDRA